MSAFLISISLLATLVATAYLYVKHSYSYWKRRGIPFKKATFPFGNFRDAFMSKESFDASIEKLYHEIDEPIVGIYTFLRPSLLVRDPKIIKDVFIKEFSSFSHRGFNANVDVDPMADNILLQRDERWKNIRTQLSPAFSSGKLKAMFQTIIECSKSMDKYVDKFADTNKSIEIRELFACYATNVIVSVAFGIDIDSIEQPDCEFRKYGQQVFEPTLRNMFRGTISTTNPQMAKLLKVRFVDKEIGDFMIDAVRQNVEYRENNNVSRKDFFQLLMQLRNTGKIEENDDNWSAEKSNKKAISLEEMAAQAFLFFAGGYESSSSTMSFLMYELAKHPEIQQKAYEEIVDVLATHNGKLSYDAVADMKYVEQCLNESLRLHPPFATATRECTKTYKVPDTDIVIEEGTTLLFSAIGIQSDAKYYDEPKKFKPERYSDEQKAGKGFLEMPNLTFGEGPRNCLGLRMGKLQSKLAIIILLQKFRFELADEHKNTELKLHPLAFVLTPVNGINLKVFRR